MVSALDTESSGPVLGQDTLRSQCRRIDPLHKWRVNVNHKYKTNPLSGNMITRLRMYKYCY